MRATCPPIPFLEPAAPTWAVIDLQGGHATCFGGTNTARAEICMFFWVAKRLDLVTG